jgi:hypothetical protein
MMEGHGHGMASIPARHVAFFGSTFMPRISVSKGAAQAVVDSDMTVDDIGPTTSEGKRR